MEKSLQGNRKYRDNSYKVVTSKLKLKEASMVFSGEEAKKKKDRGTFQDNTEIGALECLLGEHGAVTSLQRCRKTSERNRTRGI
ncbi:hypothetical protein K0M31_012841 [Melipona bicolor]|uniref:Uncharacterized protein n=1 Tax=Melipona bicolor TaxID=60889 RepID=A0AA40KH38_9HYME|nr:hypothetical protein K0M31_012841 [Melipona bicolor]